MNQIEWLRDNFFGNEAWLLLSKDLRNRYYTDENSPDQLPKFSYLYRKDSDYKTQLITPNLDDFLSPQNETKTETPENPTTINNESEENIDSVSDPDPKSTDEES